MTRTTVESRIVQLLSANGWALSYKEIHEELEDLDGKVIYNALQSLTDKGQITYGPGTYENGVEVRTWLVTDASQRPADTETIKKEIKTVAKPVKKEATTVADTPLLAMFDDAVKVMRASIEASMSQPVYAGDIDAAIEVVDKYRQVASLTGDLAGNSRLVEVMSHLEELRDAQASG